jgi:hypothetical protein
MTKTARPWHLLVMGLGMTALLGVTPARADDDHHKHQDHKHHERREHERHDHEWHERQAWCAHHPYECGAPGYAYAPPPPVVYAPPPVVYAPPPVVYAPPVVAAPGLNIVVPIHIK